MGFLTDRVAQKLTNHAPLWDQHLQDWLCGKDTLQGNDIEVNRCTAMKFSAFNACLRVLGETLASAPIKEYQKLSDGTRKETNDTGLYDLLHNVPNDEMDANSFYIAGSNQINTGGYLVCTKSVNSFGEIVSLYPREWQDVCIRRDVQSKKLVYTIDNKEYQRSQLFHINGPSMNGVIGMSPLEYMSNAIRLALTYEQFAIKFYKNGAAPSGVFQNPGALTKDAFERLKQNLTESYAGLLNRGKPMILEDGLTYNPITMKLSDAELLASKKFQVEEVCRFLRVPLHLAMNLDRATNNNIEHVSLEFIMFSMLPNWKRWESAINSQLLTRRQRDQGYYFEFKIDGLLRGDSKSMAEAFAIGRQWGWLSVNDIRRLMNLNPVPNGDIYLQPMNMIEAGSNTDDQQKKIVDEIHKLTEMSAK